MHTMATTRTMRSMIGPLLVGVLSILAAGCRQSTTPREMPFGRFAVTLSGAQSGLYDAHGTLPPTPLPRRAATFSAALAGGPLGDSYLISGFRERSGTRQDLLSIEVRGVLQPGTYLGMGDLALGIDTVTRIPAQVYRIMGATVRITHLTRTRIAGEFSGEAIGGTFPPTFPNLPSDTVRLTAGTFDVPIIRR